MYYSNWANNYVYDTYSWIVKVLINKNIILNAVSYESANKLHFARSVGNIWFEQAFWTRVCFIKQQALIRTTQGHCYQCNAAYWVLSLIVERLISVFHCCSNECIVAVLIVASTLLTNRVINFVWEQIMNGFCIQSSGQLLKQ